jgi:subtilisin
MARDFVGLPIESVEHAFGPELSDEQLVARIQRAGGMVTVGIKPPEAERSRVSRAYPAVSRAHMRSARAALMQMKDVQLLQSYSMLPQLLLSLPPELGPQLRALEFIDWIEPAIEYELASSAAGEALNSLGAFNARETLSSLSADSIPWGLRMIGAPDAWSEHQTEGELATISILDAGPDHAHFYLTGELPSSNVCVKWLVTHTDCFETLDGHGSHVAGIAMARMNGVGVVGVAPGVASPRYYRVCAAATGNGDVTCYAEYAKNALNHILESGQPRSIVNMSWGGADADAGLAQAISIAYQAGVLLIAAAGNTATSSTAVNFPARHSAVIAVSGVLPDTTFALAHTCSDYKQRTRVFGSRYGTEVELAAPFWAYSAVWNGQWGVDCGTSMSAPHVAGVAALLWSKYPHWTNSRVRERLSQSALDRGPIGRDTKFGFGVVSAQRALADSIAVQIEGPALIEIGATCMWSANVPGGDQGHAYRWYQNGWPKGTEATYIDSKDPHPNATFSIRLEVIAPNGGFGAAEIWVTESSNAPICIY